MMRAVSTFHMGNVSVAFGTVITALCPPRKAAKTVLTRCLYLCGGTAHTISFMKALSYTTLSAAVSTSDTSATLAADPGASSFALANRVAGAIANNDFVVFELDNGGFFLSIVASLSTLTFTTGAFPSAAAAGNRVWFMGAPGNHTSSLTSMPDGFTPGAGWQAAATVSVKNDWQDYASGILQSNNTYEPLMVHSTNATATGIFEQISGCHVKF